MRYVQVLIFALLVEKQVITNVNRNRVEVTSLPFGDNNSLGKDDRKKANLLKCRWGRTTTVEAALRTWLHTAQIPENQRFEMFKSNQTLRRWDSTLRTYLFPDIWD